MPMTLLDDEGDERSAGQWPEWYAGFRHPSSASFEEPATIAPYGRPKWGERTISVRVGNARARPREYRFPLVKTGLLVLKMQREFIDVGGFGWLLGNDTSMLREIVPNVQALMESAREANLTIIHVKESHRDDLSDVPLSKLKRALKQSAGRTRSIGDHGPLGKYLIEGELGNEFIPECVPLQGEKVIVTPGKGVFYGTELHQFCLEKGISHLIVAGVATEIEGQQVMRELNDRGYEPVMIVDCTASYFQDRASLHPLCWCRRTLHDILLCLFCWVQICIL